MPRLRPQKKNEPTNFPAEIEGAICIESFRPAPIGILFERHKTYDIDHPAVRQFPSYFRGLVRLDEEVQSDG